MNVDLRRTRDIDLWTLRETTSEENESGEDETPKAQIPEVNIDHPFRRMCGA
jgi:hypothetical protein